jgi:hypothetical protein
VIVFLGETGLGSVFSTGLALGRLCIVIDPLINYSLSHKTIEKQRRKK